MISPPLLGAMMVLICIAAAVRSIQFAYRYLAEQALYWGRSKVFEIGSDFEEARDSELYRDTDYILATVLHVLRDLPADTAIAFADDWLADGGKRTDADASTPSDRLELYRLEAEELPEAISKLLEVYNVISSAIAFWRVSHSPILAVGVLIALPFLVLVIAVGMVTRSLARSIRIVLRAPKIDDTGSVARVAPLADRVNRLGLPSLAGGIPQMA